MLFVGVCLLACALAAAEPDPANTLDSIKEKYEQARGRINRDTFCTYTNAVADMLVRSRQSGDFDTTLLLVNEQKALESFPIVPTGKPRETLIQGVKGYGDMIARLDADDAQRLLALRKLYVAKLELILKELLTANNMNEAKRVNDEKAAIMQLMATCTPAPTEAPPAPAPEPEPTPVPRKDVAPPGADTAATPKAIKKDLTIIKATISGRHKKSQDITDDVKNAVQDNRLAFRDWASTYERHDSPVLTIQYRFGSGMMKTIQGRNGAPVIINEGN